MFVVQGNLRAVRDVETHTCVSSGYLFSSAIHLSLCWKHAFSGLQHLSVSAMLGLGRAAVLAAKFCRYQQESFFGYFSDIA